MKKLLFLILLLPSVLYSQNRTFNTITAKKILELPYGTINMADYYRSVVNRNVWKWRSGVVNVNFPAGASVNLLYQYQDTINLAGSASAHFYRESSDIYFNSDLDYQDNIQLISKAYSNRILNLKKSAFTGFINAVYVAPNTGDSVQIGELVGTKHYVSTNDAQGSLRMDIGLMNPLELYTRLDNHVAVDSVIMIRMLVDDAGIPDDSIGAIYGIYNEDDGLRGADKTYFLYSEYGDNYLNGDLEVTGNIVNVQPHASLSFEDESETLSMDQNVWSVVTNATSNLFSSEDTTDIIHQGDSLTIIIPGDYMINASLSYSGTTNADVYEFAIFKNGVLTSPKIERSTTSTVIGNVSLPFYVPDCEPGDDLSLRIRNTANNFDATLVSCSWIIWALHLE